MEENKPKTKKIYKIGNIIFWIVLAIVAIYSVFRFTSNDNDLVSIFGKSAVNVLTPSMEDTFYAGDVIYVDTDFEINDIVADALNGTVITYYDSIDVDGDGTAETVLNSHRVVAIEVAGDSLKFVTKGDNNSSTDASSIYQDNVVAVWTGNSTRHLGSFISFLNSSIGFFIFIVLPCLAFLVYEVIKFINVMTEYKTHQALESRVKLQEQAIAIAKKQLEEEAKQKEEEIKETKE